MFGLFFVYLLVFAALAVLLFAGSLWLQGYLYSEPADQMYWRAPAAAGGITLFLAFWGFLAYRSPGDHAAQFQFSSQGKDTEFTKMKAVYSDRTVEVTRAPGQRNYLDAQRQKMPSRPLKVIVEEDGQEVAFEADRDEKGLFRPDPTYGLFYRDTRKRVMNESSLGTVEAPRRWGLLFGNILLNLLHLSVWFVCCWLLLRYQWHHALAVAAVLWLIMTIAVAEMLVQRVEGTRKERDKNAVIEKAS